MPAPDLDTLFDFENQLEENFRRVFVANEIKAFTRLNAPADFQRDTPRVEIKVKLGAAVGHRVALCPDGEERRDMFQFQIGIMLVTIPGNTEANNVIHSRYRARVRSLASVIAQRSWADTVNWPYHAISEPLADGSTEPITKTEDGFEYSTMIYSGVFAIRRDAWPNP